MLRGPAGQIFLSAGLGALVFLIFVLDRSTPPQVPIAPLYVIPLFIAASLLPRWTALLLSCGAVALWLTDGYVLVGARTSYRGAELLPLACAGLAAVYAGGIHGKLRHTRAALADHAGALEEARARLEELSLTDSLTGLANRRALDLRLGQLQALAARGALQFSVAMIDVDHFKAANDMYGHEAGDAVLRAIGAALHERLRASDMVARYGGEEFAVLLPDTESETAMRVAEELRARVGSLQVPFGAERISVSISVGVACSVHEPDVLRASDSALYEAKRRGRDQVVLASGGGSQAAIQRR
ncbi:MAG: GGDEF domain-containing protein [Chloroflexi bacterium]|nr:GGDEF domain-containing protein [Chloroflexota bacterium]